MKILIIILFFLTSCINKENKNIKVFINEKAHTHFINQNSFARLIPIKSRLKQKKIIHINNIKEAHINYWPPSSGSYEKHITKEDIQAFVTSHTINKRNGKSIKISSPLRVLEIIFQDGILLRLYVVQGKVLEYGIIIYKNKDYSHVSFTPLLAN